MINKKGIHFEVSERRILLKIIDLVMVFIGLYGLGLFFEFEYIQVDKSNSTALVLLGLYVTVYGTIF